MYTLCIMADDLSPKQKLLLLLIKDFRRKHGHSPTLGEMKKLYGTDYTNSITQLLEKLEEKNYITRTPGAERGITTSQQGDEIVNIRVVGSIACGKPLLAQENVEGYISVDKRIIHGNENDYFFLRAVGDSMNNAGIEEGDMVLIKNQMTAENGDKVVALIDDEATLKVFKRIKDYVALVPQSKNPANKPIILHSDFTIQGVVKAVYKKDELTA